MLFFILSIRKWIGLVCLFGYARMLFGCVIAISDQKKELFRGESYDNNPAWDFMGLVMR